MSESASSCPTCKKQIVQRCGESLTNLSSLRTDKHQEIYGHCSKIALAGVLKVDVALYFALFSKFFTLARLLTLQSGQQCS